MMKKQLAVAAGLALLSTSAFATKARLQALGQGGTAKGLQGSFFLDDSRNVFLNPASLNEMSNYVVTEWGTANDAADSDSAPHAEGGFFRDGGSINYGLYLGNEYNFNNSVKTTNNMQETDNNLDLFFAGNMGFDWGARISYSSSSNKPNGGIEVENDTLGLGLGINHGKVGAYANLLLKDESAGSSSSADDKFEADLGLNLGVSYDHKNMTFYADYDKQGNERTVSSAKTEVETTQINVGVANKMAMNETSMMFVDFRFNSTETETKGSNTVKTTALPLTIGFETQANSWLALRASVSQNIIVNDTETETVGSGTTEQTQDNTTNINAGATLTFGKLTVDGVIGTTGQSRAATTASESGVLATDNLMTRVAVSYMF